MIDRHFHWQFCAYNGEPFADKVHWAVTVDVIGFFSEADARIAAADVVTREQYILVRVWECPSCGYQQQMSDNFKELIKKHD